MNKNQYLAAIRSLAVELHRLGYEKMKMRMGTKKEMSTDNQHHDLGWLVDVIPTLTPYDASVLVDLTVTLCDVERHDDVADEYASERRPS
jgi:tagatose-1,6-bisphosphate aldolase